MSVFTGSLQNSGAALAGLQAQIIKQKMAQTPAAEISKKAVGLVKAQSQISFVVGNHFKEVPGRGHGRFWEERRRQLPLPSRLSLY